MSEIEMKAYRHLLYVAMLSIRNHCQPRVGFSLNPYAWYQLYLSTRVAGIEADWLHNLAQYSSMNFERFDEKVFWNEYESFLKRSKKTDLKKYKRIFNNFLVGNIQIV